jgi:UDP-N-acetylglucosamine 2-epimerase (non-hydrolysing)
VDNISARVPHTGQHYDHNMSGRYAVSGVWASHAEQTGAVMVRVERILGRARADAVLVAGDVNSTFAATVAATKLGV